MDPAALRRDLAHVACSGDTPHQGVGGSREEALAELRRLAPDAQGVRCPRVRIRIPRRTRPQGSAENSWPGEMEGEGDTMQNPLLPVPHAAGQLPQRQPGAGLLAADVDRLRRSLDHSVSDNTRAFTLEIWPGTLVWGGVFRQ